MPDVPLPDQAEAPNLDKFINSLLNQVAKRFDVGSDMMWAVNWLTKWVLVVVGVILRLTISIITLGAQAMQAVLDEGNPAAGKLAATVLGTLFGNDAVANIRGGIINPGNLEDASQQVGAAVLESIFGPLNLEGGAALEPDVKRAEGYLGAVTNLVTRGFIIDVMEEFVPYFKLDFIHHLEEGLISGLGLGRVSRRVWAPIVTTLVTDPTTWKLNLAYRPKLLSEGVAIQQWVRGRMGDGELDDELGRQGWSADRIEALKVQHTKRLSADDVVTLMHADVITGDEATQQLRDAGYEPEIAQHLLNVQEIHQQRSWLTKYWDLLLAQYEGGLVERSVFINDLRNAHVPDSVYDLIVAIGDARRQSTRRLLSAGELEAAWNKGIVTQSEYHDYLVRVGYSEDDATTKVLTNLATIRDREEAAQEKKRVQQDRAAELARQKAEREQERQAAKDQATLERQQKQAQAAAERAATAAAAEARRRFAAQAAADRKALVDRQHARDLIDSDTAAILKATIDAEHAALVATIDGQEADARASYQRQILALHQADREASIAQQLDDIELAKELDTAARIAGVQARRALVDAELARTLEDLDAVTAARAQSIDDDEAAALDAIGVAQLPTTTERQARAAQGISELDDALTRRLADIAADYQARHEEIDRELDAGDIKGPAADREHGRLDVAQRTADTLARQQHDLSVRRLSDVGQAAAALAVAQAEQDRARIATTAAKARKTLATDGLKQELAARASADAERIRLQAIADQAGPLSEHEAARRRLKVRDAEAALKRQETLTATEIAKGEADAAARIAKAQASVQAAQKRLTAVSRASTAREAAAAASAAETAALDADIERRREALEAQLAASGPPAIGVNPTPS